MDFELFTSLLWKFLFVPPLDVTGKYFGIGNCNHANIGDFYWGDGGA